MLEFKKVELQDQKLISDYFKEIPPYFVEHSFTTLLAWQEAYDFQFALDEDYIFIKNTYNGITSLFPPFSQNGKNSVTKYEKALKKIIDFCESLNLPCILSEVGDKELPLIEKAMPEMFTVQRDRNNANYIYKVEDLVKLEGKKYQSKRNHLNSFKRNYPFYKYVPLTQDLVAACKDTMKRWAQDNNVTNVTTVNQEKTAIELLLDNMTILNLKGACIMLGGQVEAFTIGEKIREDLAYIIIEKANAAYKGLYAAINQMFLAESWSDCVYVNRAEDMGLANLRRTKQSYLPYELAMKYVLKYKPHFNV